MNQNVDGRSSYWIERVETPESICCREPEYVLAFADDNESLQDFNFHKISTVLSESYKKIINFLPSGYGRNYQYLQEVRRPTPEETRCAVE